MINYFHSQSRRHHSYTIAIQIITSSHQLSLPSAFSSTFPMFVIILVICFFIFLLFLFVSTNQFIFVIILVNCVYSVKGGGVPIQMKDSDPRLPENNLDITNIHVFL